MVKADGEPCVPTQGRCDSKAPQYQVATQDGPSNYFYGSSEYSPIKILPIYTHPGLQQGFPLQKTNKTLPLPYVHVAVRASVFLSSVHWK